MQQNRGTYSKALHAGKAGYHGALAALLASRGFSSSPEILEGSLGFTKVFSSTQNNGAITADLGKTWTITGNGYKPYACGVVLHPLIDATIDLSQKSRIPPAQVARIETLVHPDVIRITGVDQPGSGLMSKFSANHAAALAYIDQAAGIAQFGDERAQDPTVLALRKVIQVKPVLTFRQDQARAIVVAQSGATFETEIAHATGTVSNPMSDLALQQKFFANATPKIGADRAHEVVDKVSKLDTIENVGELIKICA
jgi:2-methylcitrate dehydratase PrpD